MPKKCNQCACYQTLYEKGYFMFWKEKKGFCSFCQDVVGTIDVCENWKLSNRKTTTISMLDNAVKDISTLKQIFENE